MLLFVCLFACLFVCKITQKTAQPIFFTKFGGKVAHGPRKKPLDFSGVRIKLRYRVWVRLGLGLRLGVAETYRAIQGAFV